MAMQLMNRNLGLPYLSLSNSLTLTLPPYHCDSPVPYSLPESHPSLFLPSHPPSSPLHPPSTALQPYTQRSEGRGCGASRCEQQTTHTTQLRTRYRYTHTHTHKHIRVYTHIYIYVHTYENFRILILTMWHIFPLLSLFHTPLLSL